MPFRSVLQNSVNFPSLNNHVNLSNKQFSVGSSITSMSAADIVTEYNCERDPNNDPHKMLKEFHPWADGSLIMDVLAGTDNDVCKASELLEEMVSSEENYKRCNDFKNKDLNPIAEEGLEPEASTESFPSVSSSVSKNIQNVALLEMPFRSVLQNSVNFPSLNNHVNLSNKQLSFGSSITSMSAADIVTEYNCERDPNNDPHKMLKEIHPWADGSLIKDVLAGTDNDVCKASELLEEMVSSEENYKRCNDFKNKDLNPIAEEGLEPEASTESFPSVSSSVSKNIQNVALLEMPFRSVLQNSVNFPSLNNHVNLSNKQLSVGSSITSMSAADIVTEYNCERDPINYPHKMLKEIHPWADGSLIKDVLAFTDNNVCKASELLEEMVSSEENYKRCNDFKNKDLNPIAEEGLEPEASTESFPSVSSSVSKNIQNVALLEMPFRSVLQNSVNFPSLNNHVNLSNKQFSVGSSITSMSAADIVTEYNCERDPNNDPHKMLKEIHPWADGSLIKDVLAGTDDNVCKASELLEEMVSSEENYRRCNDFKNKDLDPIAEEGVRVGNDLFADWNMDLAELTWLLQEGLKSDNSEFHHESDTDLKILLNSLNCSTIEPEWEEDDVYLVHRKEALKMMRLASGHSKAAKDAYLRGDHLSAQEYSQKAREEWVVTKRLNEKAAKEILNIRNSKNDQWTLDLHGLHSAEAVTTLQEHLSKIESQFPNGQLVGTNGLKDKSRIVNYAPYLSANCYDIEKLGIRSQSSKPTSLQVITGRGNHSRGEAVLPAFIRSFLIGNGYRFEETRPGVISVRPKFRQQQLK